jgi:hypothetical protein
MSTVSPKNDPLRIIEPLRRAISERPWLLAIGFLGLWLLKYGMLGYVLAGVVFFATILLGALAIADRVAGAASEAERRQRMRNIAIGWALVGMVALFYVATIVRLGGNALNRAM